jgi:hypothetical protein
MEGYMLRSAVTFLLVGLHLWVVSAFAQESAFNQRLLKNRYALTLSDGNLGGTALPILRPALQGAQFVLVGEDHGIVQIPAIVGALCDQLMPAGFQTMALEVGPLAAQNLETWVQEPGGRGQMAAFEKKYPASIAFYNWSEEFDLLSHCAAKTAGPLHLWGLDQELMGSSGWILTKILEQKPGPDAAREAQQLLQKNDEAYAAAAKSGNPGALFMMSVSDDELNGLRDLLQKEGNATSQALFDSLLESRQIYQKNMNGQGAESNRQRALLMKHNFVADYQQAASNGAPPKVLFKFGAWHMFKGINPLLNNDLGNYVTELADGQGTSSVRILILGVKGDQLRFAGIGRPAAPAPLNLAEDKDSDFLYLKPMFDNLFAEGSTVFDLRGFRPGFHSLGPVDGEMERLIFGYDFLVLIPDPAPSHPLP